MANAVQIDLKALANWAGAEFILGKVVGMTLPSEHDTSTANRKLIHVAISDESNSNSITTKDVPFDVVSIDIGSTTRGFKTVPGASKYCISTRPISHLVRRIEKEEAQLKEKLRYDLTIYVEICCMYADRMSQYVTAVIVV